MAALACETDFVARNELFISAAASIARRVFESRLQAPDQAIENEVSGLGLRMKENIVLRKIAYLEAGEGEYIDWYLHGDARIGASLRVRVKGGQSPEPAKIQAAVHDLCLQVAAKGPLYVSAGDVPPDMIEKAREGFRADIASDPKLSSKPEAMVEGIVAGKLRKYLSETCLYVQRFIRDEALDVGNFLEKLRSETGAGIEVTGFIRLSVRDGEGEAQ
jgi:elongation factor Ts